MHRTLIALAALSFASPAFAQDTSTGDSPPAGNAAAAQATPASGTPAADATAPGTVGGAGATTTTTASATEGAPAGNPTGDGVAPRREHPATPDPDQEGGCTTQQAPVFDPGSPRLEISAGGGYAAYFVTWRSIADFMTEGREADGLWQGPFFRAEVAFALGSLSLSVLYTHAFTEHDGPVMSTTGNPRRQNIEFQWLTAEIGLQCACHDSTYVWNFGVEGGYDLANGSMMIGLEHRSMWYLWEGLFIGFDFDVAVLVGFPFTDAMGRPGPSGGGFETSLFLGYAIG